MAPSKPTTQLRILIGKPCRENWDRMSGDECVRHCDRCDKKVYNIAGLSMDAAVELLSQHEQSVCARVFRRPDGTIVTRDCNDRRPPQSLYQYSIARLLLLMTTVALSFAALPWMNRTFGPMLTNWLQPESPIPVAPTWEIEGGYVKEFETSEQHMGGVCEFDVQ